MAIRQSSYGNLAVTTLAMSIGLRHFGNTNGDMAIGLWHTYKYEHLKVSLITNAEQ